MRNSKFLGTKVKIVLLVLLVVGFSAQAQNRTKKPSAPARKSLAPAKKSVAPRRVAPRVLPARPVARRPVVSSVSQRQLAEALTMAKNGSYDQAAVRLFALSRKADLQEERVQIKYLLGVCLMELKFYQIAAFQFVDVLRNANGKYTKLAIERLSLAADELGDDTLLNYAISKVQLEDFPDKNKDIIFYRLGEIKLKNGQFAEAAQTFAKVGSNSRYFAQAKFNRGRAYLEAKQTGEAQRTFQELLNARANASVVDGNKVAAELAMARTFYQAQQWDDAIEWYRKIPRDTEFWHESIFEQSWAYLRAARFRSALSNFQSLHSTYYEEFYIPESLLLRSIVYLYICKYDEMDKVLDLFEKTYGPVRATLGQYLQSNRDPQSYFAEIEKTMQIRQGQKRENASMASLKIPYNVARHILNEGDVKRAYGYLKNLSAEKRKLDSNTVIGRGGLGQYANKILANRAKNTRISIGEMVRTHMVNARTELRDLYEQAGFIRYEMINGRKEQLKKKMSGKDLPDSQIDENVNRQFYVQNGYEYWPFDGEYWLDEIGNYHYLGKQSCE